MREILALELDTGLKTTTVAGADIDLRKYYVSPGKREIKAVLATVNAGAATDTGTLTCKLQESATTVDSDFTDVTGGGFTAVSDSDANSFEYIHAGLLPTTLYLRNYSTVTGLPNYAVSASAYMVKRTA